MLFIVLLAISLSLDAFAVAFAHGLRDTKITVPSQLVICVQSIVYFGVAIWLGDQLSRLISQQAANLIGIVLMSGMCIWMFLQTIFNKENREETEAKPIVDITIKSLNLTFKIIKNPMLCDIDRSKTITPGEAVLLGTALSIDSISAGIGYSLLGDVHSFAPFVVGLFQLLFLALGNAIGLRVVKDKKDSRRFDRLQMVSSFVMLFLVLIRIFF